MSEQPKSLEITQGKWLETPLAAALEELSRRQGAGLDVIEEKSSQERAEVVLAKKQLLEKLQIEDGEFSEVVERHAFSLVTEEWANLPRVPEEVREEEKEYLLQVARLLAGNRSPYNKSEGLKAGENAKKYLGEDPEPEELEVFLQSKNHEQSNELKAHLDDWGEKSTLAEVRQKFGITPESETPYDVMVTNWDERQWDESQITGGFMSMTTGLPGGRPTIMIPSKVYEQAMAEGGEWIKRNIAHEYAHTQQQFRVGAESALGKFWDENFVINASRSGGHSDVVLTLKLTGTLLGESKKDLYKLFDSASNSEEAKGELLQFVQEQFGSKAALALFAYQPKAYGDTWKVGKIPGVSSSVDDRAGDLLNLLIAEREKISPSSRRLVRTYFEDVPDDKRRNMLYILDQAKMRLPDDMAVAVRGGS